MCHAHAPGNKVPTPQGARNRRFAIRRLARVLVGGWTRHGLSVGTAIPTGKSREDESQRAGRLQLLPATGNLQTKTSSAFTPTVPRFQEVPRLVRLFSNRLRLILRLSPRLRK